MKKETIEVLNELEKELNDSRWGREPADWGLMSAIRLCFCFLAVMLIWIIYRLVQGNF
jgi:hypothetical protein